jgi:hypothetical protein
MVTAILVILAVSVPLQYLVRQEVVVGLASDEAHSHAHGGEEDSHSDAGSEEGEEEHAQEHTDSEDHLASEVQLGINLIPNYGFESGTREQIWGWMNVGRGQGETVYRDLNVARSGMASAAVATNGAVVNNAGWVMRLDELPLQHEVMVEGYIRTEGLAGAAFLRITLETREEGSDKMQVLDWVFSEAVAGDSDWTLCDASIYVPAETAVVWLQVGVEGQGRAWFDDISLVVEEPGQDE